MSALIEKLEDLMTPVLKDLGLGLVRILYASGKRGKLQLMIERLDDQLVTMDDCVNASRQISVLLDVEDPIEAAYTLEVTSPGVDRPLVKPEHFKRFEGALVQVQTFAPFEGKRKFKGQLIASTPEDFTIEETLKQDESRALTFTYGEASKVSLVPDYDQ